MVLVYSLGWQLHASGTGLLLLGRGGCHERCRRGDLLPDDCLLAPLARGL